MPIPNCSQILFNLFIQNVIFITFAVGYCPAKCPSLPPTATSASTFPADAMLALLGSHEAVEDFFEFSFERTRLHIPYSDRTDRRKWLQLYRRFLPHHDIDSLLSHNASAFTNGSLVLHRDLDLIRPKKSGDELVDTLLKGAEEKYAVDSDSVRSAFRDGFGVRIYAMEMRSAVVADVVEGLRAFWMVGVSADMDFIPGSAMKADVRMFAEDVFFVVMEGTLDVVLYEDLSLFPARRHIKNEKFVEDAKRKLGGVKGGAAEIGEGDVLYVPRGCGIEIRGANDVNLYTVFKVRSEESMVANGIVATMNAAKERDIGNPLTRLLESRGDVEYDATWGDVFESAVAIAAEFLPQLRRFMALGERAMEIIKDTGGPVGKELLGEEVRKFGEAASKALFEGLMDVLGGEEEEDSGPIASREVIEWAKRVLKEGDMRKMEGWFKICVATVAKQGIDAQSGLRELQLRRFEDEMTKRRERLEWRERVLGRHGVKRRGEESGGKCSRKSRSDDGECVPNVCSSELLY